jgi:hypothetical protein
MAPRHIAAVAIGAVALALWVDIIRPGSVPLRVTAGAPILTALAD